MTNKTIAALTAATTPLAGTELVPVWDGTTTKQTTVAKILTPAAGNGIDFSAVTPAAGMTSQLFNWYEEGTWTPVPTATIPGITPPTFTSASGTYTRKGREVYVTYNILFAVNGTGSGQIKLTGLPFIPSQRGFGSGIETDVVGFYTLCQTIAGVDATYIGKTDTSYPGGTVYRLMGNFTYIV